MLLVVACKGELLSQTLGNTQIWSSIQVGFILCNRVMGGLFLIRGIYINALGQNIMVAFLKQATFELHFPA